MGNELPIWQVVVSVIFMLLLLEITDAYKKIDQSKCAQANNVFQCEMIAVPKTGE